MTAIEQRHHRPDCHDAGAVDDRAATLAALSGALARRLSRHPPPRRHALERERSRWQPLWRMGLLSALAVAVAGLSFTSTGMIWKELERLRGQPADTPLAASSIVTVSTAAAATAPPPQSAAPPIDPPAVASAPAHDRTTAASRDDPQGAVDRELTWTEVHELQIRLRALKFDPGPMDGVRGPLTSAAVRRFQESQGDRATGDIGLRTLLRVRQASAAPE